MTDRLLTPAEVARLGGVSRGTVNNRMASGQLSYMEVDGNRRVLESVALAWAGVSEMPVPVATIPKVTRNVRYRVLSAGWRSSAPVLFTCQTVEMARRMAAGCPVPTRVVAVRV